MLVWRGCLCSGRASSGGRRSDILSPGSASKRRDSALSAVTKAAAPPVPRGFSLGRASGPSSTDPPSQALASSATSGGDDAANNEV